jgi:hypothetical protein
MAKTYEPISTITLSSVSASVTLSSIPNTYTDIVIVASIFATDPGTNTLMRINGDTGSNYSMTSLSGLTTAVSGRQSSVVGILWSVGSLGSANSTNPGPQVIQINNYANTTTNKTILSRHGLVGSTYNGTAAQVGLWRNTSAINSFNWYVQGGNFDVGSTFTVYGIKAA